MTDLERFENYQCIVAGRVVMVGDMNREELVMELGKIMNWMELLQTQADMMSKNMDRWRGGDTAPMPETYNEYGSPLSPEEIEISFGH